MGSRIVTVVLFALLAVLQGQMWFGRGSVPRVNSMQQQLRAQNDANEAAAESNQRLASEVQDLREGLDMVEEKARSELGMVKPDEIFVQYLP